MTQVARFLTASRRVFPARGILGLALLLTAAHVCSAQSRPFDAGHPDHSGYKLVFSDDFNDDRSIDFAGTCQPGYKWYTKPFFGGKATPHEDLAVSGGVLVVDGPDGYNASLETAAPDDSARGWVGTVFTGGYFEASIAFDPKVIDIHRGFPSFWSMAIEHMAGKGASQWEGQPPGYEHFIEIDFFEANTFAKAGSDTYSGAVHDWFGKWTRETGIPGNLMNPNYIVDVPAHTDFGKFHRYGCLVVPASAASRKQGYIQYFFDGLPTSDIVTWTAPAADSLPPPAAPSVASITDRDHLNVILGCGKGDKMRVDYVRVWMPTTSDGPTR